MNRRRFAFAVAGAAAQPFQGIAMNEQVSDKSPVVETACGKIRGRRQNGVSRFLGIPYGGDTAAHRFQPARPPRPWSGVRDCLAFGPQAPQGEIAMPAGARLDSPFARQVMAVFRASLQQGDESENCLVLNVFTLEASPRRRRPVMVWLHGGGFALGSAGEAQYDGGALCRKGDVVVVSLNHRLGALGYLYLGALSDDFADSGNVGQLDIVLALNWVRENIAAFGGDAGNVTIFGESGGGAKVAVLLAMPPAEGLFHRGIIQSSPRPAGLDKASAAALAERTLAALGVPKGDVHRLQTMDYRPILKAASAAQQGRAVLGPVVDGRSLPTDPFSLAPPEVSRGVPVIIGTNHDEATLFLSADPGFGTMTADEARARFARLAGDRADAAFDLYRSLRPDDPPTYWVTALMTDLMFRIDSIRLAARRCAADFAPVYMYRLDWDTPILGGVMRAPHGLDVPLVFDNVAVMRGLLGPGTAPQQVADVMSGAWIDFARIGYPLQNGLAWPAYDRVTRWTMIFDTESRIAPDPGGKTRIFWDGE